jgi:NAD(P)-dependent dehydrogenase (short-subunit alcohol dehydrogenase family)
MAAKQPSLTTAKEIGNATPFGVDVADLAAMHRLAAEVADRFGPVSFLMNNAGRHQVKSRRAHWLIQIYCPLGNDTLRR